jgi:hypothetical protein
MENRTPLPDLSQLSAEEVQTVTLFKDNTPCVVNIANIASARTYYSTDVLKIPQGQGSGFVWDEKGHIVTNFHVIRGASEVQVSLIDQSTWPAKIIGERACAQGVESGPLHASGPPHAAVAGLSAMGLPTVDWLLRFPLGWQAATRPRTWRCCKSRLRPRCWPT